LEQKEDLENLFQYISIELTNLESATSLIIKLEDKFQIVVRISLCLSINRKRRDNIAQIILEEEKKFEDIMQILPD